MPTFQRTREVFKAGIAEGLHLGAQLFVSIDAEPLIDEAFGESRIGAAMTVDTVALWFSAGKPLTAIAMAQLVERGLLDWDTPVVSVIPEFAQNGKEQITVRHLLTHTAGLHAADDRDPLSWPEKLQRIYASALPADWVPGEHAAYSSSAAWFVLGEMVQRLTGKLIDDVIRAEVLRACGAKASRLCVSASEMENERDALGFMYDTSAGTARDLPFWNSDEGLTRCIPGGSARGPVRELGRVYETLLAGGSPLLSLPTVEVMTSRQRGRIFDETFQYKIDCGLGFILNSNRDGMQMPYGYGRKASPNTFGHSGNQSSCAFADPVHRMAVAWLTNGMPGERRSQQRQRAINNAIYEDLGLAD